MPTGNTSPILPPSTCTIVVWLCGKIRQLNTCTNMYIHSFLCVRVACVCSTITTPRWQYTACVTSRHSGLQRTSVSHHLDPSLSCLLLFLCHPYIPRSTIHSTLCICEQSMFFFLSVCAIHISACFPIV